MSHESAVRHAPIAEAIPALRHPLRQDPKPRLCWPEGAAAPAGVGWAAVAPGPDAGADGAGPAAMGGGFVHRRRAEAVVISINCQCFRPADNACLHAAAPRKWIGMPQCVLVAIPADARLRGCAIQYPFKKPDGYPLAPPDVHRGATSKYWLSPGYQPLPVHGAVKPPLRKP